MSRVITAKSAELQCHLIETYVNILFNVLQRGSTLVLVHCGNIAVIAQIRYFGLCVVQVSQYESNIWILIYLYNLYGGIVWNGKSNSFLNIKTSSAECKEE